MASPVRSIIYKDNIKKAFSTPGDIQGFFEQGSGNFAKETT